ncbi:MAG: methionine--tRNA ligase [Clostridiales Family XIII bacterium]|jgi:methionyl-tRNA synthetase|nr:methionine--tRNA ligase [Clostridiales Family XIII bacterium]
MSTKGNYYITTPIYYPSSNLHIGHTYCTVMADAMARFKRLVGYDVMFLTGTDEHGQKIQKVAEEQGVSPKEYVDGIVDWVKNLWATMEISYDDFIRTTDDRHERRVQEIFMKINEAGDIYKGVYEGWYCTPCESFWTDVQLVDGKCPDCGRPVEKAKEEAYFFKLSKYADAILKLYDEHPDFLEPESRRNEMRAFINQGLEDLCISRSTFDWGIKVPLDEKQVIYVWLDALTNYITALGYPEAGDGIDQEKFDKYWPADVHLVGKEIVRFHSIIWPAMLMSMGLPLPKKVLGHGWLLLDGGKMSKSKGNVVDPQKLIERYGVDALKYFLLREYTFGQDGLYTNETMINRINADLANDLGNLLSRVVSMVEKYQGGHVHTPELPADEATINLDHSLKDLAVFTAKKVEGHMDVFAFNRALEEIWVLIARSNKYIDETLPWALGKDPEKAERLNTVLYNLVESLRIVSILIYPFMHYSADEIRKQIGVQDDEVVWTDAEIWGTQTEYNVVKGDSLFPRLDLAKELEALEALNKTPDVAEESDIAPSLGEVEAQEEIPELEKAAEEAIAAEVKPLKPWIDYEDFDKLDLRVGKIISAEPVRKSKKLLHFEVKMGAETRQILSGVAGSFTPEECIGKSVIVVANLKPRNMMGVESKGMILFADNGAKLGWVEADVADGESVS